MEPELITILEGPTPDFGPAPHVYMQSILEGSESAVTAFCELRTGNGDDIVARCKSAWREARPVQLDYPDDMRARKRVDVAAMRLREVSEGTVLMLWLRWPIDDLEEEIEGLLDDDDDGLDLF